MSSWTTCRHPVPPAGECLLAECRQPAAVGEIIIGILLGPSLFGRLAPDTFQFVFRSAPPEPIQILSQIGLVLLMFQIGLEFDFSHLTERANRATVACVAAASLVLPFGLGLGFGFYTAPLLSPQAARLQTEVSG